MELKLTHEMIRINEAVFDGSLEQPIELDYVLPDYYPNIFKVLKCKICPKVYSCRTSGDKLVIDGVAYIKVLYVCEESNKVHSLEQKIPYTKTADLRSESANPVITYHAKTDYCNCRVVNPRRLDVRGAVSIKVKVCEQKEEKVVSDAQGMGMQLNTYKLNMGSDHLWTTKQFAIHEELEPGYGKPPIGEMLYCDAQAMANDYKLIANKIVTKGDIMMHMMYRPVDENAEIQVCEHSVPISQILDMSGVGEDYNCHVRFDVTSIEVELKTDASGEGVAFSVNIDLTACCDAYHNKEMQGISDAFSTQFETEMLSKSVKSEQLVCVVSETVECKNRIENVDLMCVNDIWCDVANLTARPAGDHLECMADMVAVVIGCDSDGMPTSFEKTLPITFSVECPAEGEDVIANITANVIAVDCNLNGDCIDLTATLQVEGTVCREIMTNVLTDIILDEDRTKARANDSALTIYYADKGEDIWDISKRYNTSVRAIMEENGLTDSVLDERIMVLIPMTE